MTSPSSRCTSRRLGPAAILLAAGAGLLAPRPAGAAETYRRVEAAYLPAPVVLLDSRGEKRRLDEFLAGDQPVALQFIFTSCAGICPTLSSLLTELGRRVPAARLISISIDPEEDTPARLSEYHQRFGGGENWTLLTGAPADVIAVQKSFDAYRGEKMRHEPLTFLRPASASTWRRIEGLATVQELFDELGDERESSEPIETAISPELLLGRRLYRDGERADGSLLEATGTGGVVLRGRAAACATCHRPSGFGGVEGGLYVPPISAPYLFAERQGRRVDLFREIFQESLSPSSLARLRNHAERVPYTDTGLARALELGLDSSGRALDPWMPRYRLEADELASLTAYLHQLGAKASPGVEEGVLHFATVLGADPLPERGEGPGEALLAVLRAFFAQKNADTARHRERPPDRLGHEDYLPNADREWRLHVWRLGAEPARWAEELAGLEREQPVFAILGGLGDAEWQAVHSFCEQRQLPCLFPEVESPPESPGRYTVYYSAGSALEQRARERAHEILPNLASNHEEPRVSCRAIGSPPSPHSFRSHQWLRARGIRSGAHEDIYLNTLYLLNLTEAAIVTLRDQFDRELFLEAVEREAERVPNPGVYPRLSLGPGQRFASRTCRFVTRDPGAPDGVRPISDWFVP